MRKFGLVALLVVLAGCGSSIPRCDDARVKEVVVDDAREQFRRNFAEAGADPAAVGKLTFSIASVKERGQQISSRDCSALLSLKGPNRTQSMPIAYTVGGSKGGEVGVKVRLGGG